MDRRTRNNLFYALCAVFVVAGALVVLYAQGWRIDFGTFKVNKIGGIYIRSFPADARIFLNGKYVDKKPGLLLDHGRFINNLFPKNYNLKLVSDGYLDWMENVQVNPSLVTEIKYAVLIPKNSTSAYDGIAEKFWADNDQLIIGRKDVLYYNGKKINGSEVLWQDESQKTAVTENAATKTYFVNYLSDETSTSTNLGAVLSKYGISPSTIKELAEDEGGVVLRTNTKIFSVDFSSKNVRELASSSAPISKFAVSPSWLTWTTFDAKTEKSNIVFYDRIAGPTNGKTKIEVEGVNEKLLFRNDNELGVLQNDGSFYVISADKGIKQRTASDAIGFYFSRSGNMAAVLERQAVEIFGFNGKKGYWRFRLPDVEAIERLEWYADENNLFVIYPTEAKLLNLKDAGIENFMAVADGSRFYYDSKSNVFYFIKDNELRKIAFPK